MFIFSPPKPITHLVANNNILMMAMSDNTILRIDLEHPDQPDGKIKASYFLVSC